MTELVASLQNYGLAGIMLAIVLVAIGYLYKAKSADTSRFITYLEKEREVSLARDQRFTEMMQKHEENAAARSLETNRVLQSIALVLTMHDQRTIENWRDLLASSKSSEESLRATAATMAAILENIRRMNGAPH